VITIPPQELEQEVVDVCVGFIDKHAGAEGVNMEAAAKAIKDALDKQYGATWHCAIGYGFAYDVVAQDGSLW
jgi:dynein light chain 4, axonemal